MGRVKVSAFLALSWLFSATAIWPQAAAINGQIEGTVTDASGAVVPGVSITVVGLDNGYTRKQETNDAGFYRFPLLPLGRFSVSAEHTGWSPYKRTGVVLDAGSSVVVDISLQVGNVQQVIEVSAGAPIADPSRTDVSSILTGYQLANLPLVSRNPYNFILQQPYVAGRPNTEFGVPRKILTNGFNGRINYQIDGGNNTESDRAGIRLIPFSNTFVEEIQNVSNGLAPEFGNSVGIVFNTITKAGSNDLHGEGAYLFRRTDFSARPALLGYTRPTPETNVDTLFGNVGGRIIKDKLFYFAGVEHVKRDLPTVVTVDPSVVSQLGLPASYANAIPFSQNVLFFMGKLDWQINNSNRASLRFNGHRNDSPYNNGGGIVTVPQTYNFVDRSYAGSFQLVSTLRPNLLNELRVQIPYRSQTNLPFAATGTGPSITISGLISFGGSPSLGFIYKEVTPEVADNVSYSLGSHTFKAGFDYRGVRDRQTQAASAVYTFPNVSSYLAAMNGTNLLGYSTFAQGIGQPSLAYNSAFKSFYAQDNWKLRPNITLTYGLRYERYSLPDANKNAAYEGSRSFNTDGNNFAPRLGIAIGLGKQQKTVVRASGGILYDAPQTDVYRRALLNNGSTLPLNVSTGPTTSYAPLFPAVFPAIPTGFNVPPQSVESVGRDFATLYSTNATVGITRELTGSTAVSVSYLFTRGNRLPVYRNINLVPTGATLADGRPKFGTGRIDPRFGNIVIAESVGQSIYNGGNVTLSQRLSQGLTLAATYTLSHAIDDAPEQNNIDSAAQYPEDPTNRRRDRGNSLTDRRHSFSTNLVYNPAFAIENRILRAIVNNNRLSSGIVALSGDIFNIGSNKNLNGDTSVPTSLQRPLFIGRNTYRGPATYEVDMRYSRLFPIRERYKAEFLAEFTNLFNHTNVTGVNTTANVDATGLILTAPSYAWTSALDQRLIQLGIRFQF